MKKIFFALVALMCSMSMNAQLMKVMKGNTVVATYTAEQADNVVFEEETPKTPIDATFEAKLMYNGSEYYNTKSCTFEEDDYDDGDHYWNAFLRGMFTEFNADYFTVKYGLPAYYDAETKEVKIATYYDIGTYTEGTKVYNVMLYIPTGPNAGDDYVTFDLTENADGTMKLVEKNPGDCQAVTYYGGTIEAYFPVKVSSTWFNEITTTNAPAKALNINEQVNTIKPIKFDTPIPFDNSKVKTIRR